MALFYSAQILIRTPKLTSIIKKTRLCLHLSNKNTFIHKFLRVSVVFQLGILHRPYSLSKVIICNFRRAIALAECHTLGHLVSARLNRWESKATIMLITFNSRRRLIIYVHASDPSFTYDHSQELMILLRDIDNFL